MGVSIDPDGVKGDSARLFLAVGTQRYLRQVDSATGLRVVTVLCYKSSAIKLAKDRSPSLFGPSCHRQIKY